MSKSYQTTSINNFFKSAALTKTLLEQGIDLTYIDEFSVSCRQMNHMGWSRRGQKGWVKANTDNFSMSFIIAF